MTFWRVAPLVLLGGCVVTGEMVDRRHYNPGTDYRNLLVCSGYGCDDRATVALSDAEWRQVAALFASPAADAAEERLRVGAAVGLLERLVGPKAGTAEDEATSHVISFDTRGQMDCLDESTNTRRYLSLLAAHDLLRHHTVGDIVYRGYIVDFVGPHNAATLVETATGDVHVVDSWFHANGVPPEILPLDRWKGGWAP